MRAEVRAYEVWFKSVVLEAAKAFFANDKDLITSEIKDGETEKTAYQRAYMGRQIYDGFAAAAREEYGVEAANVRAFLRDISERLAQGYEAEMRDRLENMFEAGEGVFGVNAN